MGATISRAWEAWNCQGRGDQPRVCMTPLTGTYEIFLSYARKDNAPHKAGDAKGWVTTLRDEIVEDQQRFSTEPLRVFFDTSDIADMDDWRHRIVQGLRSSQILLVCLSPNYFRSEYCRWEFEEYQKHQVHARMGHDSIAPVYFAEVPAGEKVEPEAVAAWWAELSRGNFTDLRPWFPHGIQALRDAEARRRMEALGTSLWERIQRARRASGVPGNVRQLNTHFVGRNRELRELHESVGLGENGRVTVVHGLGGAGKTELVTAYAHGWAHAHTAGLWMVAAEGRKELLPLLAELGGDLGLGPAGGAETGEQRGRRVLGEMKRRVDGEREKWRAEHEHLERNLAEAKTRGAKDEAARLDREIRRHRLGWAGCVSLILLDNVSEPSLLSEPQTAGLPREDWLRVVATTRDGPDKFGGGRERNLAFVAVDALGAEEAASLLTHHQPSGAWPAATAKEDAVAAEEIARELGGFTLAVESVAVHLALHPEIRPGAYLSRLRADGLGALEEVTANAPVAAQMRHREKQLQVVLDQMLEGMTEEVRSTLGYAALLPPDHIPMPWLRAMVAAEHPETGRARPGHADPWAALRRRLEGMRLLTPGEHAETARLHRLVGACLKARDGKGTEEREQRLLEHVNREAAELAKASEWGRADRTWLLRCTIRYGEALLERGHPAGVLLVADCARPLLEHWDVCTAERAVRSALAWCEGRGDHWAAMATLLNCLGDVLRERKRHDEAELMIREALRLEAEGGPPSPLKRSRMLNNLGLLEQGRGCPEKAVAVLREALACVNDCGQTGPKPDCEAAIIHNNLGDLMMQTGRNSEAGQQMRQAMELLTSALGPEHPDVATTLHNLAMLEVITGQYTEAAKHHDRAARIYEGVFGSSHLRTGTTLADLSRALALDGEPGRAAENMIRAISILQRIPEAERYGAQPLEGLAEELLLMLAAGGKSRFQAGVVMAGIQPGRVVSARAWGVLRARAMTRRATAPMRRVWIAIDRMWQKR